jgi:2-polyprenyl-3-methyl-5-hydroxy-6-metoxy-1,4-benzoquinol methylase
LQHFQRSLNVSIRRVAIVFDNTLRPETTGGYCLNALRGLVEVEHFLPGDLQRLPRQGFDLYLRIDDGLEFPWPQELRPSAYWAIDTHIKLNWHLLLARSFDHVFAAQRDGAERLFQAGIQSARWLPLACDPAVHQKHELDKKYDLCFVGTLLPGPRQEMIELVQQHFANCFVGQVYFEEMARAYSASRLVFNRSVLNDVNMRVFEAAACGSLLITNDLADNGQDELFHPDEHLVTYCSGEELLDKARFYLKREEARERIAAAGRAEALARHTYRLRMEKLLSEVERKPESVSVPDEIGALLKQEKPNGAKTANPGTATLTGASPAPGYFEFVRPELLELIPRTARKVLDIGCGAGRLGEVLKSRQGATVVGIELTEAAGQAARTRLDEVLIGDVEKMDLPFPEGSFDSVVCGDVLEHLREPGNLLSRIHRWLRPGGVLIASIPNVRHHSVLRMLLAGDWTYEPAGLLDRTHLRFFTRRSIEKLLRDSRFALTRWGIVPGPGYEEWQRHGRPGEVSVGGLNARGLTPQQAEEFFVYQFLITATPAPGAIPPPEARAGRQSPAWDKAKLSA